MLLTHITEHRAVRLSRGRRWSFKYGAPSFTRCVQIQIALLDTIGLSVELSSDSLFRGRLHFFRLHELPEVLLRVRHSLGTGLPVLELATGLSLDAPSRSSGSRRGRRSAIHSARWLGVERFDEMELLRDMSKLSGGCFSCFFSVTGGTSSAVGSTAVAPF